MRKREREREINEKKANFKCHYNQQAWYLFNLFFFTKKEEDEEYKFTSKNY
jgi:hypothetical protein